MRTGVTIICSVIPRVCDADEAWLVSVSGYVRTDGELYFVMTNNMRP